MVVHIRGAGFINKGAELMLIAVVNRLREMVPTVRPVVEFNVGTASQRRAHGLGDLMWIEGSRVPGLPWLFNTLATKVSGFLRSNGSRVPGAQRVTRSDVTFVLDISGFAYGDQWGPRNIEAAAGYYEQVRRQGGRVVLMPQQLGPFNDERVRSAFRRLSQHCDIIYARERASYECAHSIVADPRVLRESPDFTVLQRGYPPSTPVLRGRACIVPNYKMVVETSPAIRDAYPDFLRRCALLLRERGIEPIILIHQQSGRDHAIVAPLVEIGVAVVNEPDPLRVKGIIGESVLMIGSRFHGLVSALSQGVPALGTGWSHKYQMLFGEFGCPENLVDPRVPQAQLSAAVDRILGEGHHALVAMLRERKAQAEQKVELMWAEIADLFNAPATTQ